METPTLMKLGNGLSIPSVQELAELTFAEVPSRYVCTNDENLLLMTMGASEIDDETVPVIDLQNLLSPEPAIGKSELDRLHYSCKEWGFFQLVNHGVDALLVDNVKSEIHSFFNLPLNEKTKYGQRDGDVEGFGQAFLVSENQKLDWADMFFINTLPLHLRKPHLFPNLPLPLRETIESYSSEMKKLSMVLFEMMGKAIEVIDIKEAITDALRRQVDFNQTSTRRIHSECWRHLGDNDQWSSTQRRSWGVINSTKERLSIATFHSPKLELEIGPISSLIRPETPAVFKSAGRFEDLLKEGLSRKLDGKSFLDCMRM
ncbi:hypothetical protein C5167_031349 [Papaver somniferum]|uniref:Non-haem dioxygenase N-terminal domain-containing protein n=1 Tax=Papaver somniferum TaxID=3469 RepID=A0A4Y7K5B0_PAPSO|nr:hypothetical protein C5167_031349 [Papaver somniferum]